MVEGRPCVLCVDDFDAEGIKELIERHFGGEVVVLAAVGVAEAKQILAARCGTPTPRSLASRASRLSWFFSFDYGSRGVACSIAGDES